MTEAKWLASGNVREMLPLLRQRVTSRKLRLFACACARRHWALFFTKERRSIEAAELFADGQVGRRVFGRPAESCLCGRLATWNSRRRARLQAGPGEIASLAFRRTVMCLGGSTRSHPEQGELLRHIVGNPFHPYVAPPQWSSAIVHLAEALYNGDDCTFALVDALEEAGHPELAEHFREKEHPKGCWALDVLLGKT